jgi:hypothetical protein
MQSGNMKTPSPRHSLCRCSAPTNINHETSHALPSLVRVTNWSEDDLSTRLGQDSRPPGEQALRSRVDKLTVIVQDNLSQDDLHNS